MTPETAKHLDEVEAAIKQARSVFIEYSYVDTLRNIVVIALIDQMIEHHEAMVMLVRAGKIGSTFALSRSIFESMFRGLWFALCATDADRRRGIEDGDRARLNLWAVSSVSV